MKVRIGSRLTKAIEDTVQPNVDFTSYFTQEYYPGKYGKSISVLIKDRAHHGPCAFNFFHSSSVTVP